LSFPFEQMAHFVEDYKRQVGPKSLRMFHVWMTQAMVGILLYRLERMMFLCIGSAWRYLRFFFLPFLYPLYAYSNLDVSYHADIGPGINVLHPAMGVVISGFARIGGNLTLTGGNVIGGRPEVRDDQPFSIGSNVSLGANSVVLGPVILGDNITIGAGAMVNKSFESDCILVGSPARKLEKR